MSQHPDHQHADHAVTEASADVDRYYLKLWQQSGFALNPPELRRWRWMARAIDRFAPSEAGTVLDYGCGSGRFLPLLQALDRGPVVGYDVTRSVLEAVAERHPDVQVVTGSGRYPTPLDSNAFTVAMSSEVIEHVEDQASFVADLGRVLAPGGLLVLTTPNGRFEARYKRMTRGLQPIENWLDQSTLEQLLRNAGFALLEGTTTGAHGANMAYQRTFPYRLLKRIGRRLKVWGPVDRFEHRLAGRLGRGITLMVAARWKGPNGGHGD